jgi:hypothetical protein
MGSGHGGLSWPDEPDMLFALAPLFLAAPLAADFTQDPTAGVGTFRSYDGPHCSFALPEGARARDYGTGWGVVAEMFPSTGNMDEIQPLLRVTSILSDVDPQELLGQLLGLEQQDVQRQGWAFPQTGMATTLMIAGAERKGMNYQLSRSDAATTEADFAIYAWRNDVAVVVVRTFADSTAAAALIHSVLSALTAPGIRNDSQRKVGNDSFGFRIPANWQDGKQDLGGGYRLYSLSLPQGRLETLITPPISKVQEDRQIQNLLDRLSQRMVDLQLADQGMPDGQRRAWLNVDGGMIEGVIRRWKDPQGKVVELPTFVWAPENVGHLVQLQAMPQPGQESEMLANLTRMTRLDTYTANPPATAPPADEVLIPGISLQVPRGMAAWSQGDKFAGVHGAALGTLGDGGPRWLYWSLPGTPDLAQLEQQQTTWLEAWLQRDFPRATVDRRQTMSVTMPDGKSWQGHAWTITDTVTKTGSVVDTEVQTTWLCGLIAMPVGDRTLIGALQVDVRDMAPMIDDFVTSLETPEALDTATLAIATEGFAMDLPKDGPWSLAHHSDANGENFRVLHNRGHVDVHLRHYPKEDIATVGKEEGAFDAMRSLRAQLTRQEANSFLTDHQLLRRLGARDLHWQRLEYRDAQKNSRWAGATSWIDGTTAVSWLEYAQPRESEFSHDLAQLVPKGGTPTDIGAIGQSYAGLFLPTPAGFDWLPSGDYATAPLRLTFLGGSLQAVTIQQIADPGAAVSDEELLRSLMPDAPEWSPVSAIRLTDDTLDVFGRTVPGKKIEAANLEHKSLLQAAYMDRRDGLVRVVRMDGLAIRYDRAMPVLRSLLAAVRIEGDGPVVPTGFNSETDSSFRREDFQGWSLRLPKNFQVMDMGEEAGTYWSNSLQTEVLAVAPFGENEKIFDVLTQSLTDATAHPESAVEKGQNIAAGSLLWKVDGHTLPGFFGSGGGVPSYSLVVSRTPQNYLIATYTGSAERSLELLRDAVQGLDLDLDKND